MTTPYSASAVRMELSAYMKRMATQVLVEWTPRAGNHKADALADGGSHDFDPSMEVEIDDA